MTIFSHELQGWPAFHWNDGALAPLLASVRHRQGKLEGRMLALGLDLQNEAVLETLTADVLKTSEVEGESLDENQVRSSLARRLGIDIGALTPAAQKVEGVVEMMLDATRHYEKPLTKERLFAWHGALFPTGRSGLSKITIGAWRPVSAGPMQVVSGPLGRQKVHFEAPAADRLDKEMGDFLAWFEAKDATDAVMRAAIAHLWFVTLHPFEDGNGRIARAIADMGLARSEKNQRRFYSMSAQIERERKAYYDILEATQKGDLDITRWLHWFLVCMDRALDNAERNLAHVIRKGRFWAGLKEMPLNPRQHLLLNKLFDGFEGKMTSGKWAKLAKTSTDTALRDITDLVNRGILIKDEGGGRSTSYSLLGREE